MTVSQKIVENNLLELYHNKALTKISKKKWHR